MLGVLVDVLLPILVVVGVGYTLRRRMTFDLGTINRLAMYGLSPALIFVSLVRANMAGGTALRMVLLSVGLIVCMAVLTLAITLPLGIRGKNLSAVMLGCLFMNTGNFGLPLAHFALGDEGFQRAVLFFIPQSIMAQTLGVGVAAAGSVDSDGLRAHMRVVLLRVLRMPQIYAVAAALIVRGAGIPLQDVPGVLGALFQGLLLLSQAALPLMLVILGMQLAQRSSFEQVDLLAFATGMRLVVSPMVAFALALALGMSGLDLKVGVLQSAMPTAVNMTLLALEFDTRPPLVVGTVVASSVGSLVSLTLLLTVLR
jgi:hypothetical protein